MNTPRLILTLCAGLALGTVGGLAARASAPPETVDTFAPAQRTALRTATAPETLMTPETIEALLAAAQEGETIFAGPVDLSPLGAEDDFFPPDTEGSALPEILSDAEPFPHFDGDTLEPEGDR